MDQSHAAIIRAANAALIERGDREAADVHFTGGYVAHVTDRDLSGGPAFVRQFVDMLHLAFSDIEVEVDVLVEAADRIAWQRTIRGTQTGAFRGFPATGRRVRWREMVTSRFEGDRIAEDWVVTDLAEQLMLARRKPGS